MMRFWTRSSRHLSRAWIQFTSRKVVAIVALLAMSQPLLPSGVAYAHGPEADAEEALEVYQQLVNALSHRFDPPGERAEEVRSQMEVHPTGGESVPFEASAMNQLLALASLDSDAHPVAPKAKRQWARLVASFIIALPVKLFHGLTHPLSSIHSIYMSARAFSQRIAYGFDPTLILIILVSQGTWEGIETAIMPGGVHAFCIYFNMLLLTVTVPVEKVMKLSKHTGAGLNWWQRFEYATKSAWRDFLFYLPQSRKLYWQEQGAAIGVKAKDFVPTAESELDEHLRAHKLWGTVALSRLKHLPGLRESLGNAWLVRDLDALFDSSKPVSERFYVALTHTRGMHALVSALEKLTAAAHDEGHYSFKDRLELEKVSGRLRKLWAEYASALLFYAANPITPEQLAQKKYYKRFLRHYLEIWSRVGLAITQRVAAHDLPPSDPLPIEATRPDPVPGGWESVVDQETLNVRQLQKSGETWLGPIRSADRGAISLLNRLLLLRSNSHAPDRREKRESFQRSCEALIASR